MESAEIELKNKLDLSIQDASKSFFFVVFLFFNCISYGIRS